MTSNPQPSGCQAAHRHVAGSARRPSGRRCLLLLALIPWPALSPLALSGQEVRPFSIDQVIELLMGDVPAPRILRLAGVQCIDFDLDTQTVLRLHAAGATTGFLGELAMICRVQGHTTPPTVTTVAATDAPPSPPPPPAPPPRTPLPTGSFGHLGFSAVVASDDTETIPVGAELAIGFGTPLVGLRGAVLAVGVMEQSPEPARRGKAQDELRILPSVGADLVLLPGSSVYGLVGVSLSGPDDLSLRFGFGVRIPSSDPDGYVLEVRAQQGHPRFWGEGGTWTEAMVLTVSFGLGGRGFRERR